MADQKLTALTALSVPDLADLLYGVDVSDTTDDAAGSSRSLLLSRLMGLSGVLPGGRLTLTTATPVTTSDVTGATTIYYTPYVSDFVRLYDGTRVREYAFTERSLALGTITSGLPYDLWLYDNAGTLTLDKTAWSSDSARATALVWQTGLGWTKSGDATRLWLGTFRTTSTTQTEDSTSRRLVWNAYNSVPRKLLRNPNAGGSWTHGAATTWAEMYTTDAAKLEVVCGLLGRSYITINAVGFFILNASGGYVNIGIGKNSDTACVAPDTAYRTGASGSVQGGAMSSYSEPAPLGYTYYVGLNMGEGQTQTFYGVETGGNTTGGRFGTGIYGSINS